MKLFKDPSFFTFTLPWICHAIGGWGVSTVLPTVIYELGMTGTAEAQLMTMVSARILDNSIGITYSMLTVFF